MNRFQDQVALITGASDGIGRVTALTMARKGASVLLVARRQDGWIDILVNHVGGATVIEKPASTIDELSHAG